MLSPPRIAVNVILYSGAETRSVLNPPKPPTEWLAGVVQQVRKERDQRLVCLNIWMLLSPARRRWESGWQPKAYDAFLVFAVTSGAALFYFLVVSGNSIWIDLQGITDRTAV